MTEAFDFPKVNEQAERERKRAHWEAITAYYKANEAAIMEADPWVRAVPPYEFDWMPLFSPIESAFWGDMRMEGVVLYPQWPVAGMFLDFAHPKVKVAVECDGAQWHMDRKKDMERDRVLRNQGWTVFRLTGKECFHTSDDEFDDDGRPALELTKAVLLLRTIGKQYKLCARFVA